jgi:O-antigen ligase
MSALASGLCLGRPQPLPRCAAAALVFILVALASALLSLEPGRSLGQWTKLLYLAAPLGILRGRPRPEHVAWAFAAFASVVALHCLVALANWLAWGGELRTEIDYLQLAQLAVLALALVLPLVLLRTAPLSLRALAGALAAVLLVHALLSGSRAALLSVAALALAEIAFRARKAVLLLPPLFFLAYGVLPESRRERIRDALVVEDEAAAPPSSLRMRLDMARTGMAIASDRPLLGVGLDNVRVVYDAYKVGSLRDDPPSSGGRRHRKWYNLHNDLVQIAAETGFLGLAAWLVLLGGILLAPLAPAGAAGELQRGVRRALWLFALGGLFYKVFLNFYPWRVFVVLVGLDELLGRRLEDAAGGRQD